MKRPIAIALCLATLIIMPINTSAVSAQAAVTLEMSTGKAVYEKNGDIPLPMASTTKIMTALIVAETSPLDKVCTVSQRAEDEEGSQAGLSKGEKLTVKDLLYMLMLISANDAAIVLAENTGGSVEDFTAMMNNKAKELNLTQTHFANPNGLPADNHYTTARELALLTAHALQNNIFKQIVSTKTYRLDYGNISISNSNRLLYSYDGVIGVKTGFTKAAGRCLVTAAERNGITLINVTLNDADDWNDHRNMFDSGFEKVCKTVIYRQGEYTVKRPTLNGTEELVAFNAETVFGTVINGKCHEPTITEYMLPVYFSPIEKNTVAGQCKISYGVTETVIPLITAETVKNQEDALTGKERFMYYLYKLLNGVICLTNDKSHRL